MGSGKTFLIFGDIDGIGGALTEELLGQGHDVYVTTSQPDKSSRCSLPVDRVLQADVLDHTTIEAAVEAAGRRACMDWLTAWAPLT